MKALTLWQPWASLCFIPRPDTCTGVAARWCDVHGQCTCPEYPTVVDRGPAWGIVDGRVLVDYGASHWEPTPGCPLHDPASSHPTPALPFKTIETRGWPAPKSLIGQRIAIHAAAKSPPHALSVGGFEVNRPRGAKPCLMDFNDNGRTWTPRTHVLPLPLGAVVGTAILADCVPMVDRDTPAGAKATGDRLIITRPYLGAGGSLTVHRKAAERTEWVTDQWPFGLFAPGRWAWLLTDAERFAEPVPAVGRLGVWEWKP